MNPALNHYLETISAVADAAALRETFWVNPNRRPGAEGQISQVAPGQVEDARPS